MRLASLQRLADGLRRSPHEYKPSLQTFPDISVEALARDLNLAERGRENGAAKLPPASSKNFDETEHAIIERMFSERKAAHHIVIDQFETYAQRLSALDFHGRFTVIQNAAPGAVAEFRAEALQGQDHLYGLRRALVENERERDDFRERNKLKRAPRVPTPVEVFLKVTLLVFLFVSETYVNGGFLAKGAQLGWLGGIVEALAFAILNVVISFGIGLGGVRQLNCRNVLRKFIGLLSLGAWLAFIVVLNLALAHYREVSGVLYEDAGAKVIGRILESPGSLDIRSWLFFSIGIVWAVVALVDGIFYTDPFPGYAALERRVRKARNQYIDTKGILINELRKIRDEGTGQMEEAQKDLGKRRAEHTAILEGRARLLQLFKEHQEQLERAGNALLALYRSANRRARSDSPAPPRFDERWSVEPIVIEAQLPEILLRKNLDQEIKKSEDLLRREIRAIHDTFEEAVKTYHQIDDIIPEQHHGAAIKKLA